MKDKIKRGTKVIVKLEGSVLNSITDKDGNIEGYRITDGKFWSVVPKDSVKIK